MELPTGVCICTWPEPSRCTSHTHSVAILIPDRYQTFSGGAGIDVCLPYQHQPTHRSIRSQSCARLQLNFYLSLLPTLGNFALRTSSSL